MSKLDLEPSAANCYNGYIYDPACDECATKRLACTKECYELSAITLINKSNNKLFNTINV